MSSETILQVQNLTIRFGGLTAVNNFSFSLKRNEILGLIGPNGAGKTTVFNMISGIYEPTEGSIRFLDTEVSKMPPYKIAGLGIKRTFQQSRLFESLSVLDNVLLGMAASRSWKLGTALFARRRLKNIIDEEIKQAEELLSSFSGSLSENMYQKAGDLNPGDRRKLEIWRALASSPEILLLDEPAAGMDPNETRELMNDIARVRELRDGIGIILIEHDMMVVREAADRVIVLCYGEEIASGLFEDVSKNPTVQEAYLGSN
jgi:branched-chain amino acid transport system ATP-binding protein